MPIQAKIKRNATLPKLDATSEALTNLRADTDFVKTNKHDFDAVLKRLGSINKLRTSVKTVLLESSFNAVHKRGALPDFYVENKLKLQQDKENVRMQREQERLYNENK